MADLVKNRYAHGCTHLKPDCCPGYAVCNHGVSCGHGACCHDCYETKCPSGIADVEEAAMRSLRFHQAAGSAPEWLPIVSGEDGGGYRDFLDGEPIHCGTTLELQAREFVSIPDRLRRSDADDPLEGYRRLDRALSVRYELAWSHGNPVPMLHAWISGYEFTRRLERWMRFRWPKRK
jgi:hypothetical protein